MTLGRSSVSELLEEIAEMTAWRTRLYIVLEQPRLSDLARLLREEGWLTVLKPAEYAPRKPRSP